MATISAMTKTLSARIEIDRDEMRGLNDGKSLKIGDRSITAPNPKSRRGALVLRLLAGLSPASLIGASETSGSAALADAISPAADPAGPDGKAPDGSTRPPVGCRRPAG